MGKGGAGKSTIAGTMCRCLAATGHPVLALDVDTMPGLAQSLGAGAVDARLPPDLFEVVDGRWKAVRRTYPARLVDRYSHEAPGGVRLLELGKLPRRVEPGSSVAFRWVMESFRRPGWAVVADLAAGTRQPMFRWARFADPVIVVSDATAKSILTARRLARVATHLVVNRAQDGPDGDDVARVRRAVDLPLLGVVPGDEAVIEADRTGRSIFDVAPRSPAVLAIREITSRLASGRG